MKLEEGKKYLATTKEWFFAPNGEMYKAVFGEVSDCRQQILGRTGEARWVIVIGNLYIEENQIVCAVKTDAVDAAPPKREVEYQGKLFCTNTHTTRIYMADK